MLSQWKKYETRNRRMIKNAANKCCFFFPTSLSVSISPRFGVEGEIMTYFCPLMMWKRLDVALRKWIHVRFPVLERNFFLPSWDVVTPSSLKLFNWLNDNFCFHTWNRKCDPNFSRKWALDQLTLFKMWEWAGTNIRLTAYPSPINLGKENDVTNYWKMNFLHFIYLTRKTEMEKNVGLKGNMILASREEGWQNLDEKS